MEIKDLKLTQVQKIDALLELVVANNAMLNTILDILIDTHKLDESKVIQGKYNYYLESSINDVAEISNSKI
jgi:hypothetical protein